MLSFELLIQTDGSNDSRNNVREFDYSIERTGETLMMYYTEYPTGKFQAGSDKIALMLSKAKVLYRESETEDGKPFVMLREEKN